MTTLYNFFSKLGVVSYNNNLATNIISSVRFKESVLKNNINYYSYEIKEGETPDIIAYNYYEDERYAWVVLLANKIIDPYYEWPLQTNDFKNFIIKKYGSIENAQESVEFYRNNWYFDDTILSIGAYEALPSYLKKYWYPIIGYQGKTVSYERKKIDLTVDTNAIVSLILNNTTGINLNQKIIQRTSGVISATGVVGAIDESANRITVKHITGEFLPTSGSVGTVTDSLQTFSKSVTSSTIIVNSIPLNELNYWEKVDSYTYENELNEKRKFIKLIDRQFLNAIEDEMIELLV